MDEHKRQIINEMADDIRESLGLSVPVDVRQAVAKLQGEIRELGFKEMAYEATVHKSDEWGFRINLREGVSEVRERFSIAHELGHLFLHMGFGVNWEKWNTIEQGDNSVRTRYGATEAEYEANEFAGAFLMPQAQYLEVFDQHTDAEQRVDIKRVAQHFGVSEPAARLRGRWLGVLEWD
ncbi:ImmA/IrrE family metallo-endopeptidase [Magnetofaba australis]|uniref:IrrE N-terminal-like domain-containing protein n=1 Tax=Magnetofaba australis IT-1 TaxID=1434232 RepID=A0A1Y2K8I4_9PROT|nr:ImmA/IrrE family metallo-endopeptidase [Magnetofaba australis]OSM06746.1 putative protein of unknown function DUF955 [Magnetofaba australis IT-1]